MNGSGYTSLPNSTIPTVQGQINHKNKGLNDPKDSVKWKNMESEWLVQARRSTLVNFFPRTDAEFYRPTLYASIHQLKRCIPFKGKSIKCSELTHRLCIYVYPMYQ